MDKQIEATSVHEKVNTIKALRDNINLSYLKIGELLSLLKDKDKYMLHSGIGSTWTQFVSEFGIGRQYSYDLIALYEIFVIKWQIPSSDLADIDRNKLSACLPLVREAKDRDYVVEKIYQAKELSRGDLTVALNQEKVGEHECEWETVSYVKCNICGLRESA